MVCTNDTANGIAANGRLPRPWEQPGYQGTPKYLRDLSWQVRQKADELTALLDELAGEVELVTLDPDPAAEAARAARALSWAIDQGVCVIGSTL